MLRKRFTVSILLTCFLASGLHAQTFLWDMKLDARFDNREYKSQINWPQTLFGARLTPQIGLGWGEGNYIKVGTDLMADFGGDTFQTDPTFLVYYGYESPKFNVFAGVFPRDKIKGAYSNAFFSDSVRFYDAELEGLLVQYMSTNKRWFAEFGCDWNSQFGHNSREKFMLFGSAQYTHHFLTAGFNVNMYHHAGMLEGGGVVDNVLTNPFLSADFTRWLPFFDVLTLKLGYLQAFQNDRTYVGHYVMPYGSQIELQIEKWGLGIYNSTYQGQDLMPYYFRYGNGLYYGEPFFRTQDHMYDRLEIYWKPFPKRKDLNLYIASVHHFDGKKWGWQQVMQLTIRLNEGMFRKNRKPE